MIRKNCLKAFLAGTASALALATGAAAQQEVQTETVTVTGTRISGTDTPTPVQVQTAAQLQDITPASIPEALDKNPIFMGGSTPNNATTGANGRGNNTPGYFLNLRNLGTIRTLVLLDGHRVPGTFYDTTVDTQMLPQMLVQRVETVTGGASAVYGSDAVSGVVNFILDHKFEGLKGLIQGGISDYGDARSLRAGVAGGEDLLGGHLIWSVEYKDRDALPDAAARPLGNQGYSVVGAGTAASPYYLVKSIRQANTAPGGLITSSNSPGYGMQFNSAGQLVPFNAGTPTTTTNFNIGGDGGIEHNEYLLPVSNNAQFFGHYDYDFSNGISAWVEARYAMARSYEAGQIFTNTAGGNTLTGACTPVNGVCTGNPTVNFTNNGSGAQYPVTIYSGNAFLTPAEQAFLFPNAPANCVPGAGFVPTASATACPSFIMNRMDNDLMSRLSLDQHTGALQISAGLKGTLLDKYDWDFTYGHGETRNQLTTRNNVNAAKFYAALDAVRDPATGNVVCNVSITAPGAFPGCVPLNLFGQSGTQINGSNASQAALNYVGDTTSWVAHNGLDDFSANINGTIFDGWAGPVKAAVGVEYRLASLVVDTTNPSNTFNPQYLRLAPPGTFCPTPGSLASCNAAIAADTPLASPTGTFPASNLSEFKEVQSGAHASENVKEANLELDVPLLKDLPLVQMFSANVAGRYTEYNVSGVDPTSTSGATKKASFSASTWKIGAEWQITDDVKVRASRSRDIRAPTLWDLYQGPVTTTSGVLDPLTGVSGSVNTSQVGNPNLKPEVARNTTIGAVFTPGFLPGFNATFDYFHIVVANEIAGVSGNNQTVLNICLNSGGTSPLCNLIVRPGAYNDTSPTNFPILYLSAPQNTQTAWTEGYDIEANYQTDLSTWSGLNGELGLRLQWTHTSLLKTVLTLPGSVTTDTAGAANAPGAALPRDKAALTLDYTLNGLNVDVQERYYSPIRQSTNPTLVFNIPNLPAYFITDLNLSYDFNAWEVPFTGFLNIQNLFDRDPDVLQVPGYTGSPGMNYPVVPYEDLIGRYYTIGLRFKM
ncbi:MAG TPA: TonB-dependent receptor [Rhizomicrobium sp.]|nr:TonB-dependent receptor [Rhizomicrobium sp.]